MEHRDRAAALGRGEVVALALTVLVLIGVGVLSLLQPLAADDYANALNLHRHPGLTDFVGHYYEAWTGRATGMSLLWLALQARSVFAITNALAFGALAFLSFAVAAGRLPQREPRDVWLVAFTLVTYWFALPAIAETVFWVTGAVTYLWPSVLLLAMVYPYRRWWSHRDRPSALRTAVATFAMLAGGIAAGLSHELVFGTLALLGLGFVAATGRRAQLREVPLWLWAGMLGLLVGGVLLLASPGNAARASTSGAALTIGAQIAQFALFVFKVVGSYLPKLYPWLLCLALLAHVSGPRAGRRSGEWWWWIVWALAAAVTLVPFVAEPDIALLAGQRTTIFAAVLLTIAALALVMQTEQGRVIDTLSPKLAAGAVAILLAVALLEVAGSVQVARGIRSDIAARGASVAAQIDAGTSEVMVAPLPTHPYRTVYYVDIEADPSYWLNHAVAEWYGADTIRLDPTLAP